MGNITWEGGIDYFFATGMGEKLLYASSDRLCGLPLAQRKFGENCSIYASCRIRNIRQVEWRYFDSARAHVRVLHARQLKIYGTKRQSRLVPCGAQFGEIILIKFKALKGFVFSEPLQEVSMC